MTKMRRRKRTHNANLDWKVGIRFKSITHQSSAIQKKKESREQHSSEKVGQHCLHHNFLIPSDPNFRLTSGDITQDSGFYSSGSLSLHQTSMELDNTLPR